MSFGLICLLGLFSIRDLNLGRQGALLAIAFLVLYAFFLLSYLGSDNKEEALRILVLKIPVLLFPLAFMAIRQLSAKAWTWLGIVINYALYLPAIVSVYNYLLNKELYDDLILQSKPLPVEFGYGILHINFSILLACVILFGILQLLRTYKKGQLGLPFYFLSFLVLANFIFIHILSARTGLVGLYAGIAIVCIYLFSFLPFRKSRWVIAGIVIGPVILVMLSGSLKNRITNTVEDLKVVMEGRNANDYSFAMRVKAWQNSWDVIKKNKWLGVGIGDAENDLKQNFATFDKDILPENRKNPHFQFLETAVQSGLIAAFIYLFIFVTGFIKRDGKYNFALIAFLMLLLVASCFESILESQVSVIAFVLFVALGALMPSTHQNKINEDGTTYGV